MITEKLINKESLIFMIDFYKNDIYYKYLCRKFNTNEILIIE
jgi:adenylate cyclase class IV